jgi:hypothetical protein
MVATMVRLGLALVLAALALPATTASAAAPDVWATVNVCDTAKNPNGIGIRASMPGAQRKTVRLYMRFRIEWKDPTDGLWHNTIGFGDSGFVNIGRPKDGGRRQAGYVFPLEQPTEPQRLRGKVDFQWRIGKRVVRRERARTEKGHRSAAGSDPKGYSAATCVVK